MTKQDMIIERLDIIIKLLSPKKNIEPLITFSKANNVNNTFIEDRQKEIFQELDEKEGEINVN